MSFSLREIEKTGTQGGRPLAFRLALLAFFAGLVIMPFFSLAPQAFADATPTNAATNSASSGPRRTQLTNPLGAGVTIETLVGRAVRAFSALSGSFALLMFVYGGFMWVTSGGNMDKIKKGKQIFTWATIGLIIIFGAYAFLSTFLNAFGG